VIENKKLNISAGEIRYLQSSPRDRDLVFIHGGFGDLGLVALFEKQFGAKYRITAPYLPGHSSFSLKENYTYSDMVATLSKFLTKLEVTDYVLMGHSLGGRLALDMSTNGDTHARSEVLLAPMLAPIAATLVQTAIRLTHDYMSDLGMSRGHGLQRETLSTRVMNLHKIWKLVTSVGEVENKTLIIPTTIIWGQDDTVLPLSRNAPLVSRLEGAKLKTFKGGHYWPLKISNLEILDRLIAEN